MGIGTALALCLLQVPQRQELERIPFIEYLAGFTSVVEEPKRWLITGPDELRRYWSEAFGKDPKDAPKSVDFRRYQLIAIHIGARPTSGYNVYVKSVLRLTPDTALVSYVEQKPRPLAVRVQSRTSPWVLFKVPVGIPNFSYKELVQTIKYPPVRDNVPAGQPDPDSYPQRSG